MIDKIIFKNFLKYFLGLDFDFDLDFSVLYDSLSNCILFIYNCLSDTFSKIMASLPVIYDGSSDTFLMVIGSISLILISWSHISGLLNDRDVTPGGKAKEETDCRPGISVKQPVPEVHHVDIGVYFLPGTQFSPSKHLIYDKNQDSCERLGHLYHHPTITRVMQRINGVLRPCFWLHRDSVSPVVNYNPHGSVWADKPQRNVRSANYFVTSGNLPLMSNHDNSKVRLLP